jgi:hypothetical protein
MARKAASGFDRGGGPCHPAGDHVSPETGQPFDAEPGMPTVGKQGGAVEFESALLRADQEIMGGFERHRTRTRQFAVSRRRHDLTVTSVNTANVPNEPAISFGRS